jgi:iron complex outermembrane recepter protein
VNPHCVLGRRLGRLRVSRWLGFAAAVTGLAQQPQNLIDKSLEDLLATRVTSVSKKEQPLSRVPAAIRVITAEEIRRSGAANIPDLLRMVPGVNVAQIDASGWAVSARGFSDQFSNKMLVLIDGRSVYDPLFAGTFWDVENIPLEDIDRIEVIRGPGATMWGTNAVNGVINIITKPADQTQGALLTAGGGSVERAFGTAQYGGAAGRNGHYRIFGQYSDRGNNFNSTPQAGKDREGMARGGFRGDWNLSAADKLTIEGEAYDARSSGLADLLVGSALPFQKLLPFDSRVEGGNVLGRWTHALRNGSETELQISYEHSLRDQTILAENRDAVDAGFQHRFDIGERQEIVWGLGYRYSGDNTLGKANFSFSPAAKSLNTVNAFVQDEIEIATGRLWLTVGVKVERNSYSGLQTEPGAKLLWTLDRHNALWAAFSNADRSPSRADTEVLVQLDAVAFQNGLPLVPRIMGNPAFRSENLQAYELGYRAQPSKRVTLDVATFYDRYKNLRSLEPGAPFLELSPATAQLVIPMSAGNGVFGAAYGAEVEASWKPARWWTVDSGYTWFKPVFHRTSLSQDQTTIGDYEGRDPRNHFTARSTMNLPRRFEFDQSLYYTGSLSLGPVPAYTRYDVRVGWHPTEKAEFSIVGQDLLHARHMEFVGFGDIYVPMPVKRGFYAKLTWRF